ncbi:HNH endonuclease [Methylobacter sp. BlB1]|uniref:HNH endonuclease n=1 Tax=Methylobacter sp. BlB1 TaxID=2785914 RepID=UPI0018955CCE|nr:HNH endonuclease [Methylobacter sp. BlB1]MBF6650219.1 HNH endonuclease [Methylobacter sp. BlB1]
MPNRPKFTVHDLHAMRAASAKGHQEWDNPKLSNFKTKVKKFGLLKTHKRCCYCGRNLHGEFPMVIDIEHILPKSSFLKHMFTMKNLSVACKRCNMNIKKNKTDFLSVQISSGTKKVFKSKYYKFIHPNLDNYDAHLELHMEQKGRKVLLKYSIVNHSEKGSYTYNYFKLRQLELDTFDKFQGGSGRQEISNSNYQAEFNQLTA